MSKINVFQWLVRLVLCIYAIINIDAWVQILHPKIYDKYLYKLKVYKLDNLIGSWLLLIVVALIILHITHIFKIEKKIFWILVILFVLNLLLMYLEVCRKGDS